MKMLKPVRGPQDCGSIFATSPTAPTRRLPPNLGWSPAVPVAAAVGAAATLGEVGAGATDVGAAFGTGAAQATNTPVPIVETSSVNTRRRLNLPPLMCM